MTIRKGLHDASDETRHGNPKEGRLPSFPIRVGAGDESSGNGTGLHRRHEVS